MNNHITIQRQLLCCLFRENKSMNRKFSVPIGIYSGKRGLCHRYWQCVALPICGRTKRRWCFRLVLPDIPALHGCAGFDDGIGSRTCR